MAQKLLRGACRKCGTRSQCLLFVVLLRTSSAAGGPSSLPSRQMPPGDVRGRHAYWLRRRAGAQGPSVTSRAAATAAYRLLPADRWRLRMARSSWPPCAGFIGPTTSRRGSCRYPVSRWGCRRSLAGGVRPESRFARPRTEAHRHFRAPVRRGRSEVWGQRGLFGIVWGMGLWWWGAGLGPPRLAVGSPR